MSAPAEKAVLELPPEAKAELDRLRKLYPTERALLLPALHLAQKHWDGWLPEEAILAVAAELGLPPERTNPNGSGISLGHPLGATGAILVVKALYELRRTGGRYALVTMCIGGGQGIAAVFERI